MPNFPFSYDDNDSLFLAVNNGRTALTSNISAAELTIPVITTSGFPTTGFITINSDPDDITKAEAIRYDGIASTVFNATERGAGGTPVFGHAISDNVDLTVMAEHHNELKDAVIALENFVGVSGSSAFVPKDEFGNVLITGTLTVDNLVEAGWVTASGSSIISGPGVFREILTVSGVATFGEIPVSSLPPSIGAFDDTVGTSSNTAYTTVLTSPPLPLGENLVFYRGNLGFSTSSATTGALDIRARYGVGDIGEGGSNGPIKIGHGGGAEIAGFKVITGDGASAVTIQVRVGTGTSTGEYGSLGVVSIPLGQMALVSGTHYWHSNGSDTGVVNSTPGFTPYDSIDFTVPETGEYLIIFSSELGAQLKGRMHFLLDGVEMMAQIETSATGEGSPCPGAVIESLDAGDHTIQMEQSSRTAGANTSTSTRTRFFIVNTSAFDQIQGVSSSADQSISSSTPVKINGFSQTYTPNQQEQLFVLGVAGYFSTMDATGPGYKIKNVTDGEDYRVDSGQNPFNDPTSDTLYRPTMFFHLLDDVLTAKDFDLYMHKIAGGGSVINTEGSLILWGMSVPLASPDTAFTIINSNKVTTNELIADVVTVSQSATVSGIPVMTEIPNPTAINDLTVTGTATFAGIDAISGAFTETLTVSGLPVSTGGGGGAGNITDINAQTGPSITITGVGGINTITEGNTITVTGTAFDTFSLDGYSGAIIKIDAEQEVLNSTNHAITWDSVVSDVGGWVNLASSNTEFVVPEGEGVIRVRAMVYVNWEESSTAARRLVQISHNGAAPGGVVVRSSVLKDDGTGQPHQHAATPAFAVQPGDTISAQVYHNHGSTLRIEDATSDSATWFSIERANPIAVSGTNFTAVSGTFTQSLTVSGVPVLIGTGFSDTRTFYTAPTSGASPTVLNTVVIGDGLIVSWSQV